MAIEEGGQPVIDNALLDPFQGYDADIWAVDQATGKWVLVGRFTSMEMVFRNTTRPYIEFGQRVMRQLDGSFMIGWTMDRGQLHADVLSQTFGYSRVTRSLKINRHPRMEIIFQINSPELERNTRPKFSSQASGGRDMFDIVGNGDESYVNQRNASAKIVLEMCKVETFSIRGEAGDEVITNRWEGVAEGYRVIDETDIWAGHYLQDNGGPITAEEALNGFSNPSST